MRWFIGILIPICYALAQEANVVRMFDSKLSSAVRNDACYALRGDRSPETLQAMRKALSIQAIRPCAAQNLTQAKASDLLADALLDPSPEVRAAAAGQLGFLRKAEFIPLIATAAEDSNPSVATSAAYALCQYDDPQVLAALKKIAAHGGITGSLSLDRIAELDGHEALLIARKWLDRTDPAEIVLAMRILGEFGDVSDLTALRAIAQRKQGLMSRQTGFGLMPPIDLSRAALATIALIEHR